MCKRGLDQGVTITQTLTASRNAVSVVRGQEASLLLSAGEESPNERMNGKCKERVSPEGTIHQRLRLQLLFCALA